MPRLRAGRVLGGATISLKSVLNFRLRHTFDGVDSAAMVDQRHAASCGAQ